MKELYGMFMKMEKDEGSQERDEDNT